MNKKNKKTWILIVISLVTLGLGAIAVTTSLKLSSLSNTPVAPTAPVSKPSAALLNNGCSTPYSVEPSDCNEWCDDDSDCGLDSEEATDSASLVVYKCVIVGDEISGTCRNLEYPDSETCDGVTLQGCNETCLVNEDCGSDLECDAQTDTCRDPDFPESETCEDESLLVCNNVCSSSDECGSGLVCDDGRCRNESCLGESECECPADPIACNESCDEDGDCEGDLICDDPTDTCRHPDCTGEQDCSCLTTTPTPEPTTTPTTTTTSTTTTPTPEPTLPEAGNAMPTTTLLSIGTVLLLFGAMSLLAL